MKYSWFFRIYSFSIFTILLSFSTSFTSQEVDGKKIYKKYCKSCHGRKGGLGLKGATNLKKLELNLEQRVLSIMKGKGNMTPFESVLTQEEIEAVARYTETLKK